MSWLYSLWYSKAVTLYYARDPLDYPDAIENPPHHPALGPVPADATVAVHLSSARLSGVLYFHDLVVMSARPRDDSRTYRLWSPMQLRNVRRIIKQDMLDVLISAGNVRPHLDSVVSMCENPLHWIPPRDHDEAWARLHHVRCLIIMWNQNALTLAMGEDGHGLSSTTTSKASKGAQLVASRHARAGTTEPAFFGIADDEDTRQAAITAWSLFYESKGLARPLVQDAHRESAATKQESFGSAAHQDQLRRRLAPRAVSQQ